MSKNATEKCANKIVDLRNINTLGAEASKNVMP